MTEHQEALQAALKQISEAKWEPAEQPDIGTELVLYLMEQNAELAQCLKRTVHLARAYSPFSPPGTATVHIP
jgi:hypothetical protein